jgi:hypothetical protein
MTAQPKIPETQFAPLPRGFRMRANGIEREVQDNDGKFAMGLALLAAARAGPSARPLGHGLGPAGGSDDPDGNAASLGYPGPCLRATAQTCALGSSTGG